MTKRAGSSDLSCDLMSAGQMEEGRHREQAEVDRNGADGVGWASPGG